MNYKKKYLKYKLKYLNLNKNKLRGGYGNVTSSDRERTLELQLLGQETEALTRMEQELQDERVQALELQLPRQEADTYSPTEIMELLNQQDIDELYEALRRERGDLEDSSLLSPQQRRDAIVQAGTFLNNIVVEQPNYTDVEQPNYTDVEQPNYTDRHHLDDNILTTLHDNRWFLMISSIVGVVIAEVGIALQRR